MQKLPARLLPFLIALSAGCVGEIGTNSYDLDLQRDAGKPRSKDAGAQQRTGQDVERECPSGDPKPLASNLRVTDIELYQSVRIPLVREGEWLTDREVPIIQGKRSLVRVYVEPQLGYEPHPVQAILTVQSGGRLTDIVDERAIEALSSDDQITSTFNFEIPAEKMTADASFSVVLEEPDCEATPGAPENTRFPAEGGRQPLELEEVGALRVVVVPMLVDKRVPSIGEAEREQIRKALLAYYPVSSVEVIPHPPLSGGEALTTEGDRAALAEELLHRLKEQRYRDQPGTDVYYLGLYQPASSFRAFCADVCVLGLAPQTIRIQPSEQYAVAAFFATPQSYDTIVHELGHAHGRGHSPCNTGIVPKGIDEDYPMPNGAVGDWGWDFRQSELDDAMVPPTHKDVMGYCEPRWISSYTYMALLGRSRDVNVPPAQALVVGKLPSPAVRFRSFMLYGDGRARWDSAITTETPGGQPVRARVLDASGHDVAAIEVSRIPLSHSSGELVYLPEPGPQWDTLVWGDRRLPLANILPPPP